MFQQFMLGLTLVFFQAAISGLFAYWVASRVSRAARVVGGIVVVTLGWASVVAILNKFSGHQPEAPLATDLATIAALFVGWLSGRNGRLRSTTKRLFLDQKVRLTGIGIIGISYVYGLAIGLLTFAMALRIVNNAVGFWGFVAAFAVAPLTFVVAPLFAGIVQQNWLPAIFAYGGLLTMYLGIAFGSVVTQGPD